MSAKPCHYFHQTLTFPIDVFDAKHAKKIFTNCMKDVLKLYKNNELAVLYVQERRKDLTNHFHVCFMFFDEKKLPFDRDIYKDFRADIFKRWSNHVNFNQFKATRKGNKLRQHEFNLKSLNYFCQDVQVAEGRTKRGEVNWWGCFNRDVFLSRSAAPTKHQKKTVFNEFFKKRRRRTSNPKAILEDLGTLTGKPETMEKFCASHEKSLLAIGKQPFRSNNRWREEKAIISDFMGKLQSEDKKRPLLMVPKGESQKLDYEFGDEDTPL